MEHLDDPVKVLKRINDEWLRKMVDFFSDSKHDGTIKTNRCKMGLITHKFSCNTSRKEHGHRITYTLDTLERDAKVAGLGVVHRSGIFLKPLQIFNGINCFQTDIISKNI